MMYKLTDEQKAEVAKLYPKKQTNFEKIRDMSVEELTSFLYVQFTCDGYCPVFVSRMCDKEPPCRDKIKKWLLAEAGIAEVKE